MSLDPDAETLLAMIREAGRPPFETLTPEEARQAFRAGRAATQPVPQDVAEVRDLSCPGPLGDIRLRAYRPLGTTAQEVLPALIYFHGVGLDNSEQEWGTPADWAMENGMVVAAHFLYPGDAKHRYFVEEIGVVKPDGIERFFTWDYRKPV